MVARMVLLSIYEVVHLRDQVLIRGGSVSV